MHYLIFFYQNDNFVEQTQVDEIVCAPLSTKKLDLNDFLIELVKTAIIDGFYDIINAEYIYIKDKNDGYGR